MAANRPHRIYIEAVVLIRVGERAIRLRLLPFVIDHGRYADSGRSDRLDERFKATPEVAIPDRRYGHCGRVRPSRRCPSEEARMDVAVSFRSLGLERYEALFRENDIDAEVLSDLTDDDLEKIGVSLGHRKRLLKAVAALATWPAPVPPTADAPVPPGAPADAAKRRQLTVMFCDLVGSTALSAPIRRTCGRSSAPIRTPARAWWRATTDSSPNSWATGCSPISASPALTKTTRRAQSTRRWRSPKPSRRLKPARGKTRRAGRDRDRPRCGRRACRPGLGPGAGGRRRYAQPRGASSGPCRGGGRTGFSIDAAAHRRPVPLEGAGQAGRQGPRRAG